MYITICEIETSLSSMHEIRHSKLVPLDDPEGHRLLGWGGRGEGVWDRGTHVHPWLTCMAKTTTTLRSN